MILAGLGYEPGPADGIIGNKTKRAIRAFQRQNGLEEDGLLTQDLSIRLYKMAKQNMCEVIAFSNHETLFSHRLCHMAQQYRFKPTKVFAAGDGMYMITIPKRNALALTANADTFVNSMTLLMDRVFTTQESLAGVKIAMISGSSCIAKGSRTHQSTTAIEPC
jgi:peptidoglycan hydrolase-like protein with peptidoglycan-binding domain